MSHTSMAIHWKLCMFSPIAVTHVFVYILVLRLHIIPVFCESSPEALGHSCVLFPTMHPNLQKIVFCEDVGPKDIVKHCWKFVRIHILIQIWSEAPDVNGLAYFSVKWIVLPIQDFYIVKSRTG